MKILADSSIPQVKKPNLKATKKAAVAKDKVDGELIFHYLLITY